MRIPRSLSLKGIRLSARFLGLYFIMLPFDFYRVEGIGSISRILACLPILLTIVEQIKQHHSLRISLNPITKSSLFLIFAALISLPMSISINTSLSSLFTLSMNLIMVLLVGSAKDYSDKEVIFLERCLVLCGWLTAILMISFSSFSIDRMMFQLGKSGQDPNYMCGFMLYAFCYHLRNILNRKKIYDILIVGIIIVVVILSGSRGALFAFMGGIIASILTAKNIGATGKRKTIGGLVIILAVFFLIYWFVLPKVNSAITERFTIQYLLQNGTVGRTNIWIYLMNKYFHSGIIRQIIGYGYGTTYLVNDMPGASYGHVAHNLYVEMIISSGIVGLIAQVSLQISCIKTAFKYHKSVALSTYIAYFVMGLSLSMTSYKPIWALMIMLIVYINRGDQENESLTEGS